MSFNPAGGSPTLPLGDFGAAPSVRFNRTPQAKRRDDA